MRCSSCDSRSDSLPGSISLRMTEMSVVSITRRMKSRQASTSPTSMATVRSMMTVSRKVTNSTATSERGFFIRARNVRHSLMLYDTTTSTPARQAIGIYCASGIRNRKISSSTTAWMTPATGVRPPLLILVIVRAMAPVAGMPPNRGVTTLAIPWATSSWLELCLSPVTPSATRCRQQRFDGAQYGDGDSCGQQSFHLPMRGRG